MLQVEEDDLLRFKLALERARHYHPVVRQLWLQVAGLIERATKQREAAERSQ